MISPAEHNPTLTALEAILSAVEKIDAAMAMAEESGGPLTNVSELRDRALGAMARLDTLIAISREEAR